MNLRITLESLSPVSWGDAHRRTDPLIVRIPSIRGTIRKWYRWYLASKQSREPNPDDVREKDKEIFGGVCDKALASRVRLRFESLTVLKRLRLGRNDPFLWPLRKSLREFYMVRFDLVMESREPSCYYLNEALKGLILNLILGGFGYRSARGYGSFRIHSYVDPSSCPTVKDLLRRAKDVSNAPNPNIWIIKVRELLLSLDIKPSHKDEFWRMQNLSNAYLVTLHGVLDWKRTLIDLERRLRSVERGLRARKRGEVDYRVLLGSPILDPSGRRPYRWSVRRSSPLILGLSGRGGRYVRGVLLLSRDYPSSEERFEDISGHLENRWEEGFEMLINRLRGEGFKVESIRGDQYE